jgi:hypothetical protein
MRRQTRSKARAVEGMRSLVIDFRVERDRSIAMGFRELLMTSTAALI